MKVLISGSSGLIGSALLTTLTVEGHEVIRLVRSKSRPIVPAVRWNPTAHEIERPGLEGMDAVVHLAGESIASGRWTPERKERIRSSRVDGTDFLARTLAQLNNPPRVLISGSATGFYGDRGEEELTEESPHGKGFLADVCRQWEAAAQPAAAAGIRVVWLRTGFVLSPIGGGLQKMIKPFRYGLGGRVGSGQQFISWVSLQDEIESIVFVLQNDALRGPVNIVSPNPVRNKEFTKTLGRVLRRPAVFPLPAPMARLALGEMADELLLASSRVLPTRLLQCGYQFRHPSLEGTLREFLGNPR